MPVIEAVKTKFCSVNVNKCFRGSGKKKPIKEIFQTCALLIISNLLINTHKDHSCEIGMAFRHKEIKV